MSKRNQTLYSKIRQSSDLKAKAFKNKINFLSSGEKLFVGVCPNDSVTMSKKYNKERNTLARIRP